MAVAYASELAAGAPAISATTFTITAINAAIGSTLILCISIRTDGTVTSVTDSAGNVWSVDQQSVGGLTFPSVAICSAYIAATMTNATITVNLSASAKYCYLLERITGLPESKLIDRREAKGGLGTSVLIAGTLPTRSTDAILVAAFVGEIERNLLTLGSGFSQFTTKDLTDTQMSLSAEYKVLTATAIPSADGTLSISANWRAAMVVYGRWTGVIADPDFSRYPRPVLRR